MNARICDVCDRRLRDDDRGHRVRIGFPNVEDAVRDVCMEDAALEFRDVCKGCANEIKETLVALRKARFGMLTPKTGG